LILSGGSLEEEKEEEEEEAFSGERRSETYIAMIVR